MLKLVPNLLNPFCFPRSPGFATAVFFDELLLSLTQVSIHLDGSFRLQIHAYDAYPESEVVLEDEKSFILFDDALSAYQFHCVSVPGVRVFDTFTRPPCPVASGYRFHSLSVESVIWRPWESTFEVTVEALDGEYIRISRGGIDGNATLALELLDHFQDTFGYTPVVTIN
jgi:hypothetical protein